MTAAQPKAGSRRLEYLDGLRGLAALVVVIDHCCVTFLPLANLDSLGPARWLVELPYAWIARNATFAVLIFFVLSGFVLSQSAAKGNMTLAVRLVTRYLRLTVPMFASVILAWALLHLVVTPRVELQRLQPHGWLTHSTYGADVPSLGKAIQDGVYGIYLTGLCPFNSVVWTMKKELQGSILIYLLYRFCPVSCRMAAIIVFGLVTLASPFYLGFPIGAFLRELWIGGRLRESNWAWLAFGLSLCFAPLMIAFPSIEKHEPFFHAIAAGLLVFSILTLVVLRNFLTTAIPRFLGRISYCLYLVHVPLIASVVAWLYFQIDGSFYLKFILVLLATLAAGITAAWIMTFALDEPLMKRLHQFSKPSTAKPVAQSAP